MGVLITSANFTGKYSIAKSAYSTLDSFINDVEEVYLYDLLGQLMYEDFKSTLAPSPPAATLPAAQPTPSGGSLNKPGYLLIYNPLRFDWGSNVFQSKGIVTMLCGFIFFEFMRQVKYKPTETGIMINKADTSERADVGNLYQLYNEAIDSWKAIQEYINSAHPEQFNIATGNLVPFNGQKKDYGIGLLR